MAKAAPAAAKATATATAAKSAQKKAAPAPAPAPAPAAKPVAKAVSDKRKKAAPEPDDDDEDEVPLQADDDDESSDEDEEDAKANRDAPILDAGKLPSSKDDTAVNARLTKVKNDKTKNNSKEIPGVLYVGRLPHGFYEDQLRAYFSQFGTVTRLRLSRNRSTGAPKHYAFIEFADRDVAAIVQETMDNYLLDGHLIQVKEMKGEEVHERLWVGSGRKFRPIPRHRVQRLRHDQPKTDEQKQKVEANLLKRESKRRRKLEEAGINYQFDGYKEQASKSA
ncbi:unnamed protein product [Tilletia controversa]|nr:unnamed protein product [Tilletia controversa]